jgi:apolipoprotein N-acyltransferase
MVRRLAPAAACVASGLAVGLVFWPYRAGFLAFFVLVPFIIFSGLGDGRSRPLANCYLFGVAYFLGSLYWIARLQPEQMTVPALRLPAALVLSLYLALFMLLTGFLTRRLVLAGLPLEVALALAWGGVEYLRSLGPLGFPWASLGYALTPYPVLIQHAAVVGTYGLSAWLVLLNGLVARLVVSRRPWVAGVAAAVFAIPVVGGGLVLSGASGAGTMRVALLQPNIAGAVKWDEAYRDSTMAILADMTRRARGVQMIVWPETAVPLYVKHSSAYLDTLAALASGTGAHILTGFPDYERGEDGIRYYNSAMLVSPDGGPIREYRKIHLVPFGEMIPFEDRIAILRNINFGEGDFSPGKAYEVFQVDRLKFAVAICFESIYPSLTRKFVDRGASFIVNITNDEWFGASAGPYQHAQMAVMRSVECRVGLARCANTGLSMLVDPYGRVTRETELFKRDILVGEVVAGSGRTPYRRAGHLVDLGLLAVPLALAGLAAWPRFRRAPGGRVKGFDRPALR